MDIDTSISDVLREVIKFLECLRDVQLPLAQESLRQKLVMILKNKLTTMTRVSPEPYLDMAPGPKNLLLPKSETDLEEYVEPSQKKIDQNYYERVGNNSQSVVTTVVNELFHRNDNHDENQRLIEIYKNLPAAQAKSKCHKCGPLHRKEGKKLFLSESRACWIALVGSHLLIYRNEKANRPYAIYPVRNYMARPAPNLLPRDRQRSESAFEIYSPGSETLQFIARTPKDMDQWIAKVCEMGHDSEKDERDAAEVCKKKHVESQISDPDETARDTKKSTVDKPTKTDTSDKKEIERNHENPPPLPARIPRRLPSLPSDNAIVPCKTAAKEDDDEDEIYHKIEDLKNGMCYQNVALSAKKSDADEKKQREAMYDDIRSSKEKNEGQVLAEEQSQGTTLPPDEELYDDIGTILRTGNVIASVASSAEQARKSDRPVTDDEEKQEQFYDDVGNLIPNEKLIKDRAKNPTEASKFLQKKSFLDRVLSKRELSGKSDKKYKGKAMSPPSPSTAEKMPVCNDASDLTPNEESLAEEEEEFPEYNCPPPPRPIYTITKSSNNPNQVEEFYDDVSGCRGQCDKNHRSILDREAKEIENGRTCNVEARDEASSPEEILHYQSPRSDLRVVNAAEVQPNEELYDDIALWAEFTARQRDNIGKKDGDDAKSTITSDKKSWNRFVVNKILRTSDSNCSEVRRNGEGEELEDSLESNSPTKRNTFQRLISKMENSLAKVSTRNSPSLSPGQSSNNS